MKACENVTLEYSIKVHFYPTRAPDGLQKLFPWLPFGDTVIILSLYLVYHESDQRSLVKSFQFAVRK